MDLAVHPGRGIGALAFGCSRDAAVAALGRPDRIEETEDHPGERCIEWHYDALGLSLYLDEDAGFRLGLVDASSLEVSVRGVRPIGLELEEAKAAFQDLGGLSPDGEFTAPGRCAYDLQDEFVTLWFQDGVCDSIQVFVPSDSNDEYVWPPGAAA